MAIGLLLEEALLYDYRKRINYEFVYGELLSIANDEEP